MFFFTHILIGTVADDVEYNLILQLTFGIYGHMIHIQCHYYHYHSIIPTVVYNNTFFGMQSFSTFFQFVFPVGNIVDT